MCCFAASSLWADNLSDMKQFSPIRLKFFFLLLSCLAFGVSFAQSVSPQVMNAAGGGGPVGATGVEVYYNIGEAFYTTVQGNGRTITQGFLQPDVVGEFGLSASAFMTPASCADKADGSIRVDATFSGGVNVSSFRMTYYWSPAWVCAAGNSCSTIANLPAGTYSLMVVSEYTVSGSAIPNDTVRLNNLVISGSSEPCLITVYNGLSPNEDGVNDVFYIENIGQFPGNKVEIYNRWGQKLAEIKNYDNVQQVWRGTIGSSQQIAPAATYFYIIHLNNHAAPIKGWLELTNSK